MEESYIVSGTNNDYLSFLRQKESTEIFQIFKFGDIAVIQKDDITSKILGIVDLIEDQPTY